MPTSLAVSEGDIVTLTVHLRAAHCAVGQVRFAGGASAGKGRVVKQVRVAGTVLTVGTPVALKLGSR